MGEVSVGRLAEDASRCGLRFRARSVAGSVVLSVVQGSREVLVVASSLLDALRIALQEVQS